MSDHEHVVEEPYCDYCERSGHSFRSCPARDDENVPEDEPWLPALGGTLTPMDTSTWGRLGR